RCFVAELGALGRGRLAGSAMAGQGPFLWGLAPSQHVQPLKLGEGDLPSMPLPGQCPAAETWLHFNRKPLPVPAAQGGWALGAIQVPPEGLQGDTQQPPPHHCPLSKGSLPKPAPCQVCALRLVARHMANKKQM
uniref:Uncharacterized protein n=1 Tax=Saimiri boliviensis boliviensis TaxID=39432 RepID=A0A2K6UFB5_SAIBB